ncbi:PPE family protein [Mycobacterium kansasii]|uniref:PPE family protein n=1 Tax=Mycobacterium kansasii TaxID=1768 RepID=UPI000C071DE6
MNFVILPPEINSTRMFSGAGLGPMLAASAAWDGVAAELGSAATSFEALTAGLAGGTWLGAASAAMLGAAAPYAAWLQATASDAEQAAAQARSAVSAFEAAQPATVHPAIIAGNRSQLLSLVMSNLFGQNAPAIALAEAEYEQMWAQDVTAMLGYHLSASAAVAQLPPWQELPQRLADMADSAIASWQLPNINIGTGNTGSFNIGNNNTGNFNIGSNNIGNANIGNANAITSATPTSATQTLAASTWVLTTWAISTRVGTTMSMRMSVPATSANSTSVSRTPATRTSASGTSASET